MNIVAKSGINVLTPEGDLTILETAKFTEALLALHEKKGPIELNLSQVQRMDSSAIRLVVAACRGEWMGITGTTPAIRDTFRTVGCESRAVFVQSGAEA
ncbi:MAG: STAS domain-containing protein [Nitrospinae bacterium]|nr:STAS domain-containing protein [Nitrospinota bacterium]